MSEQLFQSHFVLHEGKEGSSLNFQSPTAQRAERIDTNKAVLLEGVVTEVVPLFMRDFLDTKPPSGAVPAVVMPPHMLQGFLSLSASISAVNFNETLKKAGFQSKDEAYRMCLQWVGQLVVLSGYHLHGMLEGVDPQKLIHDIDNTVRMLNETSDLNGFFPLEPKPNNPDS